MSLKPVIGDLECPVGSVETIQVTPTGPTTSNRIWNVLYGVGPAGPISVPLNPSGDSFTIKVLPGMNLLQVLLTSSSSATQTLVAQQPPGGPANILEDDIEIVSGLGGWSPQINGI